VAKIDVMTILVHWGKAATETKMAAGDATTSSATVTVQASDATGGTRSFTSGGKTRPIKRDFFAHHQEK
jgi:hypothetical protein